jgi:hypothetical protein
MLLLVFGKRERKKEKKKNKSWPLNLGHRDKEGPEHGLGNILFPEMVREKHVHPDDRVGRVRRRRRRRERAGTRRIGRIGADPGCASACQSINQSKQKRTKKKKETRVRNQDKYIGV